MVGAPLQFVPNKDYKLVFSRQGRKTILQADGRPVVELPNAPERSGPYAGLGMYQTNTAYDDVTICGTLEREWIEAAVTTLTPAKGPKATAYTAQWSKMNPRGLDREGRPGELPKQGVQGVNRWLAGAAYDSKRKLCLMYGGPAPGNTGMNDIWGYDAEKDTWTCLEKDDPSADGVRRPKVFLNVNSSQSLPFACDPVNDLYWLTSPLPGSKWEFWHYNPEKRTFEKTHIGERDGPVSGLIGSCPQVKSLVSPRETIDLRTMKASVLKSAPQPLNDNLGGVWHSNVERSGGFGTAASDGSFLVFGIHGDPPITDTWRFEPIRDRWIKLSPKVSPSPRIYHFVVHDSALGVWVLFGGVTTGNKWLADTWLYAPHLGTWFDATPKTGSTPPPGIIMWYDESRDLIVLFAGEGGETWTCKIRPSGTLP
jgi:hypothetical protein